MDDCKNESCVCRAVQGARVVLDKLIVATPVKFAKPAGPEKDALSLECLNLMNRLRGMLHALGRPVRCGNGKDATHCGDKVHVSTRSRHSQWPMQHSCDGELSGHLGLLLLKDLHASRLSTCM